MAGFANYAAITAAIAAGQIYRYDFAKTFTGSLGLGRIYNTWNGTWTGNPPAGAQPTGGGSPVAATVYTNALGSINFQDTSPKQKYLMRLGVSCDFTGTLYIFDRLVAWGDIACTAVNNFSLAQPSPLLPRYLSAGAAEDVQCWFEVSTQSGVNPITANIAYTNQAGVGSRTGPGFVLNSAGLAVGVMRAMALQTGDTGVTAVTNFNVTATSTGVRVNLNLVRLIATMPVVADIWNERDFTLSLTAMPRIYDGASLMLCWLNQSASATPNIRGSMDVVYA